jgi:hypothetical protein
LKTSHTGNTRFTYWLVTHTQGLNELQLQVLFSEVMSTTTTEEDTELRDLVAATLENSGILGKIKAQLRANVYIALEEGKM